MSQAGYIEPFKNPVNRIQKKIQKQAEGQTSNGFSSRKNLEGKEKCVCELFKGRRLGGRCREQGCVMEVIVSKV